MNHEYSYSDPSTCPCCNQWRIHVCKWCCDEITEDECNINGACCDECQKEINNEDQ